MKKIVFKAGSFIYLIWNKIVNSYKGFRILLCIIIKFEGIVFVFGENIINFSLCIEFLFLNLVWVFELDCFGGDELGCSEFVFV